MSDDAVAVCTSVQDLLPPTGTWDNPKGYPDSLALCVVDSVFSLRATYTSTVRVLDRYRTVRRAADADPNHDDLHDLVAAIDHAGGPAAAAGPALFDNLAVAPGTARPGRPGALKAVTLYEAATRLTAAGVVTGPQLVDRIDEVRAAWLGVRGLGRVSWEYLRILTGQDGVKADTLVRRFVARAVGVVLTVSDVRARRAVEGAAELMQVDARVLDDAIWSYENGLGSTARRRKPSTPNRV